jgi:hypothetical protein
MTGTVPSGATVLETICWARFLPTLAGYAFMDSSLKVSDWEMFLVVMFRSLRIFNDRCSAAPFSGNLPPSFNPL